MLRGENDNRFDRRLKRNPAGIVSELTCEEAENNVRFYACSLTPGRADSSFYTVGEDDNNEVGPPSHSVFESPNSMFCKVFPGGGASQRHRPLQCPWFLKETSSSPPPTPIPHMVCLQVGGKEVLRL